MDTNAASALHTGHAVIEEGNLLGADPEPLEDVAEAFALRFAECNLIREEAVIEPQRELKLTPKPRDVELIRIAQARDGRSLTCFLEELKGTREGTSKPRSEFREKGSWSHGEAEFPNGASGELLRRAAPPIEEICAPRLRPEAIEFLFSHTTVGEPCDGLQASEVEKKPAKIEDESADRDGLLPTDGA